MLWTVFQLPFMSHLISSFAEHSRYFSLPMLKFLVMMHPQYLVRTKNTSGRIGELFSVHDIKGSTLQYQKV